MAKTIAVSNDAYELLSKAKLAGESYSDVIRRCMRRSGRLMDIFGSRTLSKQDWEEAEALLKRAQVMTAERLKRPKNEAL